MCVRFVYLVIWIITKSFQWKTKPNSKFKVHISDRTILRFAHLIIAHIVYDSFILGSFVCCYTANTHLNSYMELCSFMRNFGRLNLTKPRQSPLVANFLFCSLFFEMSNDGVQVLCVAWALIVLIWECHRICDNNKRSKLHDN